MSTRSSSVALVGTLLLLLARLAPTACAQEPRLLSRSGSDRECPRLLPELPILLGCERQPDYRQYPRVQPELPILLGRDRDSFWAYLSDEAKKNTSAEDEVNEEECTPLDNLQKLQLANAVYELGLFFDCMRIVWMPDLCYIAACQIAPGSRIEEFAIQRLGGGCSSDPNLRMKELIDQSEDLWEIQQGWGWFGFTDHPSHLVPEAATALPPPPPAAACPVAKREPKTKQVSLNVLIAEVPRGRFLKEDQHVKVLKPAAYEKLVERIQKLRDEGKAKLVAEPRMTTLSGRQASFLDGGERAIETHDGLTHVGVEFEEFGTRLTVKPTVLAKGKLQLEVEPEISRLDPAAGTTVNGVLVPGRTTQRLHTTFEMKDGQTVAIGGLQTICGDEKKAKKYETIILVTPRVVRPEKEQATATQSPR
jgi:hypothetical protein